MSGVELSEVIADLRANLQKAQTMGEGEALRFAIEEIEVELHVTVSKEINGKSGVKFEVLGAGVNLGADGKLSNVETNKIKLKMKAVDKRPEDTPGHGLIGAEGPKAKPPARP